MSVTKKIIGLASTAVVFAGMAFGQNLTCSGTAAVPAAIISPPVPIELRSESATELVSDTISYCNSAPAGSTLGQVTVTLSATGLQGITSKILNSTTGVTDATLSVYAQAGGPAGTAYYQGTVSGNIITFGTAALPVTFPTYNFTLQISNVRVNVVGQYPANLQPVTEAVQLVAQGNGLAAVTNIPAQVVGNLRNSLAVTGSSTTYSGAGGNSVGTAAGVNTYLTCSGSGAGAFSVTIAELFAGAFKTKTVTAAQGAVTAIPGATAGNIAAIPGSESGSLVSGAVAALAAPPAGQGAGTGLLANTGAANFGTRLKLNFTGIPTNATLLVPTTIVNGGFTIGLTSGTETAAFAQAVTQTGQPAGYYALTATSGAATAIYEVTIADYTSIGSFTVTPIVTYTVNTVVAPAGPITVAVSYSASPAGNGGAITLPTATIPYFANTSTTLNGSTFAACQTTLLFPFVTNQAGFETGLVVANTGKDNLSSTATSVASGQSGACTFQFYGSTGAEGGTAPALVAAPNFPKSTAAVSTIAAGATHADILTNVAGGSFQGYAIATCPFLYAKGFAYIAYGLLQNNGVAMGYTANLISNGRLAFATAATGVSNASPEASGQ